MTGNQVAIANAGSALLAQIMGEDESNPFADETKKLDNSFFGFFLNIDGRSGNVTYKDDETELDIDIPAQFYVNVETMMYGWQCWVDSKPVDEHIDLYLNKDNLPPESEFKDHGPYGEDDGWSDFLGIHLLYVNPDGPEDGSEDIPFTYNASSGGGKRGIRMFLKDYMKKIRQHIGEDGQLMIPMVELDIHSFKTKKNHKIFSPTFEIVGWEEKSSFGTSFDIGGENDDGNYDDDDDGAGSGADENDSSNYDDKGDVTDIDPETGDPIEDAPKEKAKDAPKGRGRGGRGKAGGKTATKHEKPQDAKGDKPAAKPAGRRGRRGTAK